MSKTVARQVHATSIIDSSACIADTAEIGPYCVIGPDVRIGEGTRLIAHVCILRATTVGRDCTIWPNAVLGAPAQVYKDDPSEAALVIGDRVTIREGVTINLSTGKERPTSIGNDCLIMATVHVAHECQIGNAVTIVNGVGLAGHCQIKDGATIGGLAGVHQHVLVGEHSFVGGGALVTHDVLPCSIVTGNRARTTGLNVVGLQRKGWTEERIKSLHTAMMEWFRTGQICSDDEYGNAQMLRAFVQESKRGICRLTEAVEKKSSRI